MSRNLALILSFLIRSAIGSEEGIIILSHVRRRRGRFVLCYDVTSLSLLLRSRFGRRVCARFADLGRGIGGDQGGIVCGVRQRCSKLKSTRRLRRSNSRIPFAALGFELFRDFQFRIVSWKDAWEPGDTVRKLQHLDGDVMSIDQRALTSVTRRIWAESKDLHLHNLDRQSFKGTQDCTAANPFNQEPFLHNFVTIKTGDTLNPDLDITSQSAYVIRADPRSSPLPEPLAEHAEPPQPSQLLVAYGPDGKAVGTITRDRLLILYRSYEQTSTNREDTSLDAFPHAVASLIQRYREGRQTEGYQVQMNKY